jgi:hypothetical protein
MANVAARLMETYQRAALTLSADAERRSAGCYGATCQHLRRPGDRHRCRLGNRGSLCRGRPRFRAMNPVRPAPSRGRLRWTLRMPGIGLRNGLVFRSESYEHPPPAAGFFPGTHRQATGLAGRGQEIDERDVWKATPVTAVGPAPASGWLSVEHFPLGSVTTVLVSFSGFLVESSLNWEAKHA